MSIKSVAVKFLAVSIVAVGLVSCGGSKTASSSPTVAQKTNPRGVKLQKEECEEFALEETENFRASGSNISMREQHATQQALLDARASLAQQLGVMVNGMLRSFSQEHEMGGAYSSMAKSGGLQQAYFEQFLQNTRPKCKNTYLRDDGRYQVYVAIEMEEREKRAIVNQLKKDQILTIDFAEHQFMQEMKEQQRDFRQRQLDQ